MGQKKLIRFEELKTFRNVLQHPENMQGKWHSFFENENPVTLELACGKGEYAVGLGRLFSNKNFIGIDIKGNRIWKGAKTALNEGLKNVAFLRTQIDKLTDYFVADEVAEIWITFPDPQLRLSKIKKRLTHPKFLRLYKNILQKDGIVHLKTDSPDLYNFTKAVIDLYQLKIIDDKDDLYKNENISEALKIKTHYESLDIAQSNKVHYLAFELNNDLPKEKDEILKNLFVKKQLNEDEDYYFNNDGLVVFTKEYLLERGYCCGNGCANCPYDYKMVPEPKRSLLLEKRSNENKQTN